MAREWVPTECVLCDWTLDWSGTPWAVYLPGEPLPVGWTGTMPATVHLSDTIDGPHVAGVALAAHWAEQHRTQLEALIGPGFELLPGIFARPDRMRPAP